MIAFELHKSFISSDQKVNIEVRATLEEGKITAIYGRSGSGKTSILRMIAGLLEPDHGIIQLNEAIWFSPEKKIHVKTNKRSIGMVFQDYALFPNLSVLENIQYGIEGVENDDLLDRILEISDLKEILNRYPKNLSGGQQQRVALARALIRKPKLLLLDEPMSALDTIMRNKLQNEILALQKLIPTTIILVSHHIPEVYKLADYVYVLENGQFIKQGTPSEVFIPDKITEAAGELISSKNEGDHIILKLLIDGKVTSIKVSKKMLN